MISCEYCVILEKKSQDATATTGNPPTTTPQEIDPEQWLVSQGLLQVRNSDNTPPVERAALVKKFRSHDLL